MERENNASAPTSETPNGTDPQGEMPTTPNGETPESTTDTASSSDDIESLKKELEGVRAAHKKANAEAASNRKKAKELDDLRTQLEADKLSETEKLQRQVSDLQSKYDSATRTAQERTLTYEVKLQAAQLGIVDPDAASVLLDKSAIEYDDNGQPTNVEDLLKSLLKAKPYLAGKSANTAHTSGGATNPSRSQTSGAASINEEFVLNVLSGKLPAETYSNLSPEQKLHFATVQQTMARR